MARVTTSFQGSLEHAHDRCGQEGGDEVEEHPGQAFAHGVVRWAEDAVLFMQTGQVVHVLGGFFGDDIDDVIHRDDAEHPIVDVGHWNGE